MSESFGDLYQARITSDGRVVTWKRGEPIPPEVGYDICGICWAESTTVQKLLVEKVEFPGKLGKVGRPRRCPIHGVQRVIKRQKEKTSPSTLKEPGY